MDISLIKQENIRMSFVPTLPYHDLNQMTGNEGNHSQMPLVQMGDLVVFPEYIGRRLSLHIHRYQNGPIAFGFPLTINKLCNMRDHAPSTIGKEQARLKIC